MNDPSCTDSLPSHIPQVLINREPLNHLYFDVELLGDCDVIVNELCHRLGGHFTELCLNSSPATEIVIDDFPAVSDNGISADPADSASVSAVTENAAENVCTISSTVDALTAVSGSNDLMATAGLTSSTSKNAAGDTVKTQLSIELKVDNVTIAETRSETVCDSVDVRNKCSTNATLEESPKTEKFNWTTLLKCMPYQNWFILLTVFLLVLETVNYDDDY